MSETETPVELQNKNAIGLGATGLKLEGVTLSGHLNIQPQISIAPWHPVERVRTLEKSHMDLIRVLHDFARQFPSPMDHRLRQEFDRIGADFEEHMKMVEENDHKLNHRYGF